MEYIKTNSNDFVDEIVKLKEQRGLSYRALGEAVNIKESTLLSWTHKNARIPLDKAVAIMNYFGYNLAFVKKEQKKGDVNAREPE